MNVSRIVYIVDDDAVVRASLAFFLKAAGFATRSYASGRDFIADVTSLRLGCILLDVRMPDFDGFDVLAALGDRTSAMPAIVMTGHGDVATAVRAMKLGASDFLEKPCDEDEMIATLERAFVVLEDHALDMTSQDAARAIIARLTQREHDVLHGLIEGRSNKVLAYELGLSVRTVEMHRASMMDRLGVRTLPDALRIAFRAGILPIAMPVPTPGGRHVTHN
ncbi:response regulator transcription factor [Glacieibacterium frigidum]|uniref:Response regulator n=1 Tax=Glacieibacterium frigidum TaxID=2593303 RepID=A0A552UEP6_9SPHN|nr:response regulator [Glacieibacterium frigidum]TRW16671.1 response regulator [Glacieibacterium frigidum]